MKATPEYEFLDLYKKMTLTVLVLADYAGQLSHMNSVKWPCSPWCWGLRVFLCLTLVLCWSVHFSSWKNRCHFFFKSPKKHPSRFQFFLNYPIKEIIAQALNSLPTKGMPLNGNINFSTTSRQNLTTSVGGTDQTISYFKWGEAPPKRGKFF